MGFLEVSWAVPVDIFIGLTLIFLAIVLLVAGRKRSEGLILALFLVIVGLNFLFISALLHWGGNAVWERLAFATLALDPLYLLLFATSYPYRRRPRAVLRLLQGAALWACLSLVLVVFRWDLFEWPPDVPFGEESLEGLYYGRLVLFPELIVCYAAAWLLSIRTALEAPTPSLRRRAAWSVGAIGVAVVPRLGLTPSEFPVNVFWFLAPLWDSQPTMFLQEAVKASLQLVVFSAISGGFYVWGLVSCRRRGVGELRSPLRIVFWILLIVAIFRWGYFLWPAGVLGANFGEALFFGFRWVIFAGILVYGVLAYDVVDLKRLSQRALPRVGAGLAFVGTFLLVTVLGINLGQAVPVSSLMGALAGAAVLAPGAVGVRLALRRLEPRLGAPGGQERRLELYRAALEVAWSSGPPSASARKRLDADRRAFGVSVEEARTLEHVVAVETTRKSRRLETGEEASPGILIDHVLGEGAHGRIYAGRRMPSGERLVIKEIHVDRLGAAGARRSLLQEARSLRDLQHPNIVRLLDVQVTPGRYLLLLEHVEGRPLSAHLGSGPFSESRTRKILVQILDALETTHAQGIVHRDIKPSNILVGRGDQAWLTDFGVAASEGAAPEVQATVTGLSALDEIAGTPNYMAPEQVRGRHAGAATDLYAVGLVAFEMLAGRSALDLRGLAWVDAFARIVRPHVDLTPMPSRWRPALEKSLQADPSKRFQSAREMRLALEAAIR